MSLSQEGRQPRRFRAPSIGDLTVKVRGQIETIYFSSPRFSAGKLRARNSDLVAFAGALMVRVGDAVVLHGVWERHPKYGQQLKVTHFTFDQKLDASGLAHYLANHPALKGIGPVRAKKIAEAFGVDFDRVIDEEPAKIAEVAKLPMDAVNTLRDEWLRTRTVNATLTWLSSFGLTHHQATKLIERLGNSAVTALETDPYLLVREIPGFGFKRVDEVALRLGTSKSDPGRLRAGVVYCVAEQRNQGDCWVDYEDLLELANQLLVMDTRDSRERIEKALDEAIERGDLECRSIGGRFLVADPALYRCEAELAAIFATQLRPNPHFAGRDMAAVIAETASWVTEGQRRALEAAAAHNMVLISGAAGSGKTSLIDVLVKLYRSAGKRVVMAAPTGKAAKRMEEVVGGEALTIHRLLGYDGRQFALGPEAPLEADVLIADESSMVDAVLAWHLLRAVAFDRTAVVLVGDHNQLPPVGPGNPLRDLIERQPIPTVVLDQVMRQAGVLKESSIAVLRGEVRKTAEAPDGGRAPWIVVNRLTEVDEARDYLLGLFKSVLAEKMGFDLLEDVQLLTPTRKGPLGVEALNIDLQRLLQKKLWGVEVPPPRPGRRPPFLLHDRVIQRRNNYDLGVMNGAIGIVTGVGPKRELQVSFDGSEVELTPENEGASDLSLAYALTIHSTQGSQFPCAVVVCHKAHSFMHHRNLLYTAVTRAQQTVILVGDQWGIRECAQKQQVERRKTFLSVLDLPERGRRGDR